MFDTGGGVAERQADAVAWDAMRFGELSALSRIENAHAARKILLAGELTLAALERDVALRGGDIRDCGNEAVAEVSTRLGCSHTMASHFCDLGVDLRLRLPLTRAAFLAGDLDYARVWRIHRETIGLRPGTLTLLEAEIVASALRLAPAALGREIRALIVRASPDEAASDRELAEAECRIKVRPAGPLSEFTAVLTAEQGRAAWQLVCEMADTVCAKDRRGRQTLLVDAFVALLHGESGLPCTCEKPDCPKGGGVAVPGRRKPLVQITVDVATLLGLVASPAYLEGHGPIDPQLARLLAEDATWQAMLTEMIDLATELGLVGSAGQQMDGRAEDAGSAEARDDDNDDGDGDDDDDADARGQAGDRAHGSARIPGAGPVVGPPDWVPRRAGLQVFRDRGLRHRAGRVPPDAPTSSEPYSAGPPPVGLGTTVSGIEDWLAEHPEHGQYGDGHGDGHGGLAAPPPGALTYRPDAATTAMVRTRDGHCRFPGCSVPAARCQLDHVVPFTHRDPRRGGWTIASNLQCLCQFHHNLKTMDRYGVAMLGGSGVVVWTSSYGTTTVTMPGGHCSMDTVGGLAPRVPRRGGDSALSRRQASARNYSGAEPPPF